MGFKRFIVCVNFWYNKKGDNEMVNYPNGKKAGTIVNKPTSWSNRGTSLEDDLNKTNQHYQLHGIALIHKKPTPVQVVNVSYPARSKARITEAYYKVPSTTDYNGVYKGFAIDFEAKQTKNKTSLPLKTIHQHQIAHLRSVVNHGGHAFLIIRFTTHNETYILEFERLDEYIKVGSPKSIPYQWIKSNSTLCKQSYLKPCDYIHGIEKSLIDKGDLTYE